MKALIRTTIAGLVFVFAANAFALYNPVEKAESTEKPPNRLIVKLRSDLVCVESVDRDGTPRLGIREIDDLSKSLAVSGQKRLFKHRGQELPNTLKNVFVLTLAESGSAREAAETYSRLGVVEYAIPDEPVELYYSPDDPLYLHQWALNNIGQGCYHVDRLPNYGDDTLAIVHGTPDSDIDYEEADSAPPDVTETVVVAIIDTGVDMDHPDLIGKIWTNPGELPSNGYDDNNNGYVDDYRGWDFAGDVLLDDPDNDPTDSHGHGTHCSGIVAATSNNSEGIAGVAFDCEIMPLSFHPLMMASWAAEAIIYAADNGADVVNMSWGLSYQVQLWEDALDYAASKGVILVAAAGNDGFERINYPAGYSSVIAVSASTRDDEVAFFSTYGTNIHVSAPGYSILSLRADDEDMYASSGEPLVHIIDEHYYLASGTSMAAPYVAGVAAYVEAITPGISQSAMKALLASTSDDITDPFGQGDHLPGWDKYSGHGRINVFSAANAAPDVRIRITSPLNNSSQQGTIDVYGIADGAEMTGWTLEYGQGRTPAAWTLLTSSSTPVTDDLLYSWDASGMNGIYSLRLTSGSTHEYYVTFYVMNDLILEIISPTEGDTVQNFADIVATAMCPDFSRIYVTYGSGASPSSWETLAYLTQPVMNETAASLSGKIISEGEYTVRMRLYSTSGLEATEEVTFFVTTPFTPPHGWRSFVASDLTSVVNWGDFDGDGFNEFVVGYDGGVKFFNLDGTLKTTGVPSLTGDFRLPAAVGNLDNDGLDDIVMVGGSTLFGFPSNESDFEIQTRSPSFGVYQEVNETRYPVVQLIDLDGNGDDEIVYSMYGATGFDPPYSNGVHSWVYDSDGSPWTTADTAIISSSNFQPADLDGDGQCEFYYSGLGANQRYLYKLDSQFQKVDSTYLPMLDYTQRVGGLTAVDVDGDYILELALFGYKILPDYTNSDYYLYVLDENLDLLPGFPHETGINGYFIMRTPMFCDLERDGTVEYFSSYYDLDRSYVYAWRSDGTPVVGDTLSSGLYATSPNGAYLHIGLLADVDGNGYPDYSSTESPTLFSDFELQTIVAWDRDGTLGDNYPIAVTQATGQIDYTPYSPVYGDFNRNGYTEMVMATMDGYLIYTEFEESYYSSAASPRPIWRYDRSLTNTYYPFGHGAAVCGDADASGGTDIDDVVFLVRYVFMSGPAPSPEELGDVNCTGNVDIDDVVYLINYVFQGGPTPCDTDGDEVPDC